MISFALKTALLTTVASLLWSSSTLAESLGNQSYDSFSKVKKILMKDVYHDHLKTFYCDAKFDQQKNVFLPPGFLTTKHKKRSKKIEWEHVVPAENMGRSFVEWRAGNPSCINKKGKSFKGRRCAEKVNMEYRLMQADMYNLVPAIGAVNAMRSNYNFRPLPSEKSDFGTCNMKIDQRKVEPPERARGAIARTYKYMHASYPRYKMSRQQQQLMDAWDNMYPVTEFECLRTKRIELIQRNENKVVKTQCLSLKMWNQN